MDLELNTSHGEHGLGILNLEPNTFRVQGSRFQYPQSRAQGLAMADTKDDTKSPALMLSWSALTSTLPFERKKVHY